FLLYTGDRSFLDQYETAVLKALKKIFSKGEAEQPASSLPATTPSAPAKQGGARDAKPKQAGERKPAGDKKPRADKPRRERPAKPADSWKLEDFVVEPQEGKTRFHDFKLAPELMHAIHDLGFPYCTPIQAGVLGYTLKGQDAIGRAQTGTGKTAAFL